MQHTPGINVEPEHKSCDYHDIYAEYVLAQSELEHHKQDWEGLYTEKSLLDLLMDFRLVPNQSGNGSYNPNFV